MIKLVEVYKSLLVEKVVNLWTDKDKEKYAENVWELFQNSYAKIGGFKSAVDTQELIQDTALWKCIRRNGEITAVSVYKDKYGRKSIGSATNGTEQGKKDLYMIWAEDVKMNRSWSEVSGAAEHINKKMGVGMIPNRFAAEILGKEILDYNEDGYHYTRLIAGHPHEKLLIGDVEGFNFDI